MNNAFYRSLKPLLNRPNIDGKKLRVFEKINKIKKIIKKL